HQRPTTRRQRRRQHRLTPHTTNALPPQRRQGCRPLLHLPKGDTTMSFDIQPDASRRIVENTTAVVSDLEEASKDTQNAINTTPAAFEHSPQSKTAVLSYLEHFVTGEVNATRNMTSKSTRAAADAINAYRAGDTEMSEEAKNAIASIPVIHFPGEVVK
ncbi:DUF6507 family protein, partial [Dermabacter hominis]